jgi:hypothetical protein
MKKITVFSALVLSVFAMAFSPVPGGVKQTASVSSALNDYAFLRAHRQGRGITLTWGMTTNSNLIGFDIEKTMEDPNDPYSVWMPVTNIPGANERSFKHNDNDVLPGTSNYRITAWYSDGRSSMSEIISVKINAR